MRARSPLASPPGLPYDAAAMAALPEDLFLTIEEWSALGSPVRVIARADNVIVARAAFAAACETYPKQWIRLRNRALVMAERKPGS